LILVESSVWIDYFRGVASPETDRLDGLLEEELLAIGDLILTEVLQGFDPNRDFNQAHEFLTALTIVELGGREIAVRAAKNYRKLRALGVTPRKTIDTIIATRCIESGWPLLYSDRDFDPFVARLGLQSVME
jgi:predicted nucleic acid-binding protein